MPDDLDVDGAGDIEVIVVVVVCLGVVVDVDRAITEEEIAAELLDTIVVVVLGVSEEAEVLTVEDD